MNDPRAERRRREREERKRQQRTVPKTVYVGDNIVASGLGGHFDSREGRGSMPAKTPGVHRWCVFTCYSVRVETAETMYQEDRLKFLDQENLLSLGIACWDCEQPLGPDADARSTCPAGDTYAM